MVKLTLTGIIRLHKSLKKLRDSAQSLAILRFMLLLFSQEADPRCLRSTGLSWPWWPLHICVLCRACPCCSISHISSAARLISDGG